jgi:hypothetical protein
MFKLFYLHIMFIAKLGSSYVMDDHHVHYITREKKEKQTQCLEVQGHDNVKLEFFIFSNSPS